MARGKPRIAIVGGGPGGLFTVYHLKHSLAARVTLFEQSERLGGKVLTDWIGHPPARFEAGTAEYYHPVTGHDPLLELMLALGLRPVWMPGGSNVEQGLPVRCRGKELGGRYGLAAGQALDDFEDVVRETRGSKAFSKGGRTADQSHPWTSRTFRSILDRVHHPATRHHIEVACHSDTVCEPDETPAMQGADAWLCDDPEYCKIYGLSGGNDRLIKALTSSVTADIRLNARVDRVTQTTDERYRIEWTEPDAAKSGVFDTVVVALPIAALVNLRWGSDQLEAAVQARLSRYSSHGSYVRVTVLFREAFLHYGIPETYFQLDQFGGCTVYDEGMRWVTDGTEEAKSGLQGRSVLSWLLAGQDAERRMGVADTELVREALDSLPGRLGTAARALFVEGRVHRWPSVICLRPGTMSDRNRFESQVVASGNRPGVVLVGDYFVDSTINGALEAGRNAVKILADSYNP